jgi:hypothetical protein
MLFVGGVLLTLLVSAQGFVHTLRIAAAYRLKTTSLRGNTSPEVGGNGLSRALFSLTEVYAKLISPKQGTAGSVIPKNRQKEKALIRVANDIRAEYEALFWVTGDMDISLWADDCTFSDPFSSFGGSGSTRRFEANAKSLGRLVLDPVARVTSFEVVGGGQGRDEPEVRIGWSFKSKLDLPWRPVLAAAGTTIHVLNKDSLLIERYEERWKSKPWDVVKRLFVPTPRE